MNDTSAFSRVTRTSRALYGPRKLLICGFTPEGQTLLNDVVTTSTIRDLPLAYAATSDLVIALADIFSRPADTDRGEASRMPAAIIMAGITENELHLLMSSYRTAGLPNPLWATLTPTSEAWTLRQLLKELTAEKEALAKQPSRKKS